jgi:hypothetical protein
MLFLVPVSYYITKYWSILAVACARYLCLPFTAKIRSSIATGTSTLHNSKFHSFHPFSYFHSPLRHKTPHGHNSRKQK